MIALKHGNLLKIFKYQVFFNRLLPDHESVDAFQSPYKLIPHQSSVLDSLIDFALGGYARWDAQYFLHIATLGYTHENCLAFFPAFPLLNKILSHLLQLLLFNSVNSWNAALLSSVIINNFCFVIASKYLYHITIWLGANSSFATKTMILFVISPANIFFSAPYSESLFCALTFGGISYCLKGKFFFSSLLFAVSTGTRSNGLLNIGFLVCFMSIAAFRLKLKNLPIFAISVIPSILLSLIPFILYQYYAFSQFCHVHSRSLNVPQVVHNYLSAANFTIPGERVPRWCHQSLPLSYSSVQSDYWNVGFLRYFEWKQIPNFILAMPVLSLVTLYSFLLVNNLMHLPWIPLTIASLFNRCSLLLFIKTKVEISHPIFRWEAGIFAAHSTFLAVFTFLFAHVQVEHYYCIDFTIS